MNTSKTPDVHWTILAIYGLMITSSIGFLAVTPVMLGGMVDHLGFSRQLIGWVAAANSFGVAMAGLTVSFLIQRFRTMSLIRLGLSGLILFELISLFISTPGPMLVARFFAGLSGGFAYASGLSSYAGLSRPVRGFSTYTIVFCLFTAIILFALPDLIRTFGLNSGFLVLAGFPAFSLILTFQIKAIEQKAKPLKAVQAGFLKLLAQRNIFFTVLAYFSLQAGAVAIWAFLERIGNEKGFDPTFIGLVLGATGICGILGAITVNFAQKRSSLLKVLFGGFPFLFLGLFLLYSGQKEWIYLIAVFIFAGSWAFTLPLYQSIQAAYDPRGSIVSLGAFMNMLGQATGPALASVLLGVSPYINVVWISMVMFVISIGSILPAALGLRKQVRSDKELMTT